MNNPILIELTRGPLLESAHAGALAIAAPTGDLVLALGDVERPVFPRSAVKALQCLPLIETGAADRFRFGAPEIALACASHAGTERHTRVAAAMLERVGLRESHLACGAHMPLAETAARALACGGASPTQLHNNCSGKHAGMLATARYLGEPLDGYWEPQHPVQERIRRAMSELAGLEIGARHLGVDGCSVPTWAMPLKALAAAFARLGARESLGAARSSAARRIFEACWEEPELVAGAGRADTLVMKRLPGRVFMKTGAEGAYCGSFPELGLGFALKIDDGAKRAAAGTAMALVERLYPEARGLIERRVIRSWRGAEVGGIQSSRALARALDDALPKAQQ